MNNFIPVPIYPVYNAWTYPTAHYPVQQIRETMNRYSTREEVFKPDRGDVDTDEHGSGYKLYRWPFLMLTQEYLVCRMFGKSSETVISGGFTTNPIGDVYAVQNFPSGPQGWVITLKNNSNRQFILDLFLLVKV
ncbi:hypothetical protein [Brevibacillus laterosporus]|uniref:hypothetical protein n=1 Tax=Brevibacillus laterosporus TaxID=1465 RepID=UPI000839C050|nr:hypothetical protein [Brevibacillus laterosporus]